MTRLPRHRSIHCTIVTSALFAFASGASGQDLPPQHWELYERWVGEPIGEGRPDLEMNPDRPEFLEAQNVLDARDDDLRDIRIRLEEKLVKYEQDGSSGLSWRWRDIEIWRVGDRLRMEATNMVTEDNVAEVGEEIGDVYSTFRMTWDGSVSRTLSGNGSRSDAFIMASESPLATEMLGMTGLGLRMTGVFQKVGDQILPVNATVADAFRLQRTTGPHLREVISPYRGDPDKMVIRFHMNNITAVDWHFRLDLGGMFEARVSYNKVKDPTDTFSCIWVEETMEVDGVTMPKVIRQFVNVPRYSGYGTGAWEIKQVEFSPSLPEDEFKLAFPTGTKVVDQTERIAYVVEPDGSHRQIPLYNPIPIPIPIPAPSPMPEANARRSLRRMFLATPLRPWSPATAVDGPTRGSSSPAAGRCSCCWRSSPSAPERPAREMPAMSASIAPKPVDPPSPWAQWPTRLTLGSVAALLLAAAALKFHHALSTPAGYEASWMDYPAILASAISWEAVLAVWLLSGRLPRAAWAAALATFGLFALVALGKVMAGEVSCGCFGQLQVDPRLTLGLDLGVLALLLLVGPVAPGTSVTRRAVQGAWGAVAMVAILLGPMAMFLRPQAVMPGASGIVGEKGSLVVLEPETWVGRRLPILERIRMADPANDLAQGRWKIVFFRHDCDACRAALPGYEQEARRDPRRRVALVEVTPPKGASLVHAGTPCAVGRLDGEYEWFIETPTSLEVVEGVVRPEASAIAAIPPLASGSLVR